MARYKILSVSFPPLQMTTEYYILLVAPVLVVLAVVCSRIKVTSYSTATLKYCEYIRLTPLLQINPETAR